MSLEIKDLLKTAKIKRHICPFFEEAITEVEQDGEHYRVVMYVQKKKAPKNIPVKDYTYQQRIFEYYKRAKDIKEDDKEYDKKWYQAMANALKSLEAMSMGKIVNAFKAIENTKYFCESKSLNWTLNTVVKGYNYAEMNFYRQKLKLLTEQEREILKDGA
jgi:hypothetical protein